MPTPHPKRLLVEGEEDKRIIPEFMECFIPWGKKPSGWPVEIVSHNGVEDLLDAGNIATRIQ